MQRVRTIILIAKNNGWIHTDPFANYKYHTEKTERAFLTKQELERITQKGFSVKRLEQVRDVFIFSCFCGLAYTDIAHLTIENIRIGFDGNSWIIGERKKTGVKYRVPLMDVPASLIEKYHDAMPNGLLLPVISNQKINAYLKEIADVCGIDKKLSFHVARHTFATLTLTKGVSIESVSKMLGHTNIKTQIYARITDNKISDEMNKFAEKVGRLTNQAAIHL
jgi:site-specific recombinase XerD